MELKAYENLDEKEKQSAISSLVAGLSGGAGWAGKEFLDLAKQHKDYVPERLKDGNVLGLTKRKPPLQKWLMKNPETAKAILRSGEAGIVAGGAKGMLAGGILGSLIPYALHGQEEK